MLCPSNWTSPEVGGKVPEIGVEQRGLPRTIGADDREQGAVLDIETDVIVGEQAAERLVSPRTDNKAIVRPSRRWNSRRRQTPTARKVHRSGMPSSRTR